MDVQSISLLLILNIITLNFINIIESVKYNILISAFAVKDTSKAEKNIPHRVTAFRSRDSSPV